MVALELARVAERAERYDDMAEYMKERAMTMEPLNSEERDMFSAAFKNALTDRRVAVRIAVQVYSQELSEGSAERASLANGYKTRVENELQDICKKVLHLLEKVLLPSAAAGEAKTFYLKMQGDYCRYLAEFSTGDALEKYSRMAAEAYSNGMREALALHEVHPVRLGLALNFSVFQHEVLHNTAAALDLANSALHSAQANLDSISEDSQSDALLTLQLLADNTALWTAAD
ncbi:unnamed protein product [Effrenium voratum]|nr:unnamed protein product [Effrenium voratum]CAJ1412583.1 unnamed protein product [Effrenium voratum]